MVLAAANGMFLIVAKNNVNAISPVNPRISSHFLFFPKIGIPRLLRNKNENENETTERKNTSSCTGIAGSNFAQVLTTAKKKTEITIK